MDLAEAKRISENEAKIQKAKEAQEKFLIKEAADVPIT